MILNIQIRKNSEDGKVVLEKVDYTPIYMLDNGKSAENRYTLVDMKQTAKDYLDGNNKQITKLTYNKLISGLTKLEEIIRQ